MAPTAPSPSVPTRPRETLAAHLAVEPEEEFPGVPPAEGLTHDISAIDFGEIPSESSGGDDVLDEEDPVARISELMMSSAPEPIPDIFASTPSKVPSRRKGAAGLALLGIIVLIGGLGVGLYFLQSKVVDIWPPAAQYYEMLGVRNEEVGAGLSFRNYNSERLVQDANEVLIVRGVIANTSDQAREVPLLRLSLYNNDKLLQEKIISPPQTGLEARSSVGFRITLDQPDPNASRFEVTFAAAKPPARDVSAKDAPAKDAPAVK